MHDVGCSNWNWLNNVAGRKSTNCYILMHIGQTGMVCSFCLCLTVHCQLCALVEDMFLSIVVLCCKKYICTLVWGAPETGSTSNRMGDAIEVLRSDLVLENAREKAGLHETPL